MMSILVAMLLVLVEAGPSHGQRLDEMDFGRVADSCSGRGLLPSQEFCFGYLEAVTQVHLVFMLDDDGPDQHWEYCVPEASVAPQEKAAVVGAYATRHPETRFNVALYEIMKALNEAWPCPTGDRRGPETPTP